jgi:hypothetical protein
MRRRVIGCFERRNASVSEASVANSPATITNRPTMPCHPSVTSAMVATASGLRRCTTRGALAIVYIAAAATIATFENGSEMPATAPAIRNAKTMCQGYAAKPANLIHVCTAPTGRSISARLIPNCDAAIRIMNAAHSRDARSFGLMAITTRPSAAHAAAMHARMIVRAGSSGFDTAAGVNASVRRSPLRSIVNEYAAAA